MAWWKTSADGIILQVHVVPRAPRTAVAGLHGDALKIRLQAPPVDNKANRALERFLARCLDLPAAAVEVVHGRTGRRKTVRLRGTTEDRVRALAG